MRGRLRRINGSPEHAGNAVVRLKNLCQRARQAGFCLACDLNGIIQARRKTQQRAGARVASRLVLGGRDAGVADGRPLDWGLPRIRIFAVIRLPEHERSGIMVVACVNQPARAARQRWSRPLAGIGALDAAEFNGVERGPRSRPE
jgi:hypothetical protein